MIRTHYSILSLLPLLMDVSIMVEKTDYADPLKRAKKLLKYA
jgi:hypothetical protein